MLKSNKVTRALKSWPHLIIASLLITGAALFVYSKTRATPNPYRLAEDMPRGALVYAQFSDLPGLLKQWNDSTLKQRYIESANYRQFQHQHLALKLISRWEEFNEVLGFQLDTSALSDLSETTAAIAIYDIGRLDVVLIAPLSETRAAASKFFQSKDQFEEVEAPDGTTYYRHELEADRGRQKQTLAFATIKDRFVLASDEKLLVRAVANINHKGMKDSLADDQSFRTLTQKLAPHFATVWVDQAKLNEDYYFRHYWLPQNLKELKNIRAGLFDLERHEPANVANGDARGREWIERREFLAVNRNRTISRTVTANDAQRLFAMLPGNVPFVRIQSVAAQPVAAATLARDAFFDRVPAEHARSRSWSWSNYDSEDFDVRNDDEEDAPNQYSYLNSSYETRIDDPHDARITKTEEPGGNPLAPEAEQQLLSRLGTVLASAQPTAAAFANSPHTASGPMFVEFRRVAIFTLQRASNLNANALEDAVATSALSRITVAGPTAQVRWESHSEDGVEWRSMQLPMLGWELCYGRHENELVLANSRDFLKTVLSSASSDVRSSNAAGVESFTIVRLDRRKEAFDDIVNPLDAEAIKARQKDRKETDDSNATAEEFFSGNIASLLNVASAVQRVEVSHTSTLYGFREQVDYGLK